ncbi:uncharacterized protein G2W53_034437 [Senna tora]|uniref:DUF3741 domain-containing protein n=1 Tax=Senna tora TaxID=362788 RepID=A0A834T1B0_9FABA|nr:uncharacterized protein G2W53_034437 [Senna tora]
MAKRSDFAQKLLDDLRLRKERMNVSQTQKSSQSNQLPIDAYAYSKQTYRGSRSMKANENVSTRTGGMPNRSSRSHRSAKVGEVSNQIVPYGRGRSSDQTGDMSLALTFEFENGGKVRRTDSSFTSSIMGFLSQLKRGTMNFGKMERQRGNSDRQLVSTSHFPALSPVQINEIYKGAQKLNQILRASPNGLTIDRHSIEFAKELLQGAINLEESLKMLVDLQKNSEFMVTPQKKNRLILLEDGDDDDDDDDDDDKINEQKQLARPIFSFDKRSKHSQNVQGYDNTNLKQRPNTLNYSKGRKLNNEKQDVKTSKLLSHKPSTSYSSDIKNLNVLSEQENQRTSEQSNPEKSRIPNIVAKLMGLDNLPKKDSGSTQKIDGMPFKHNSKGSAKKIELKNKQTENLPQKKQKVMETTTMPTTRDKELMFSADKNSNMQKASSKVVAHNGTKALKSPDKVTVKIDKQQDGAAKLNFMRESQMGIQMKGRKQDHTNIREQKGTGKGRTNDLLLNNMLTQVEQAHQISEVKSSLHEERETKGSIYQLEKRQTSKHILSNQKRSQNHLGIQKSNMVLKYGPQEEKRHGEQQLQEGEKQMLPVRPQKGTETTSKNLSRPSHEMINSQKKQLVASFKHSSAENVNARNMERFSISYRDDLIRDEVSNDLNVQVVKEIMNKESDQISSPRLQQSEQIKGRSGIPKVIDEKRIHRIADKKVKNTRKETIDMPGKIDEVSTGRNGTMLHIAKQVKQQSPILRQVKEKTSDKFNVSKEAEGERVSMFKKADACVISSNALVPKSYSPDGGELQSPQETAALVPNNLHQGLKPVAIGDFQDQPNLVAADEEFKTCEIASYSINGMHGDRTGMDTQLQLQDQNISVESPQALTESENCLKWNLVKSQLFLNTAEALFRFDMPFSILQGGGQDNQDLGSKLLLDCGYEVMKRKGIRQELKVHPCSKISISTSRIRSLDDLVRKLNEDLQRLTLYGKNRVSQVDVEDYLPKMLENDVYNKDPDIDCMWELGWNDETFAFIEKYDAVRNMEKHVLNGLLDEITRELWHFQGELNMTTTKGAE